MTTNISSKSRRKNERRAQKRREKREAAGSLIQVFCSKGHKRTTRSAASIKSTYNVKVPAGATTVHLTEAQYQCRACEELSNALSSTPMILARDTDSNNTKASGQLSEFVKEMDDKMAKLTKEGDLIRKRFRENQTCVVVHNVHFVLKTKDGNVPVTASFRGKVQSVTAAIVYGPKLDVYIQVEVYPRRPEEGLEGSVHFRDVLVYPRDGPMPPGNPRDPVLLKKNEAGRFCVEITRSQLRNKDNLSVGIKCKPGRCGVPCPYHRLRPLTRVLVRTPVHGSPPKTAVKPTTTTIAQKNDE